MEAPFQGHHSPHSPGLSPSLFWGASDNWMFGLCHCWPQKMFQILRGCKGCSPGAHDCLRLLCAYLEGLGSLSFLLESW